jgi:hypothetical protein
METPKIPFGYRRVVGQLQKGDGVWDGERFRKVKKQYPNADGCGALLAIRRCAAQQPVLPGTEEAVSALSIMEAAIPLAVSVLEDAMTPPVERTAGEVVQPELPGTEQLNLDE